MNPEREHRIARARAMRAQGLVLREIAQALGVDQTTVIRWLNPTYAQAARRRSRDAKHRRRRPCERCSHPLSYDRQGGLCQACQRADTDERNERAARLHDAGQDPRQIAHAVGIAEAYAYQLLGLLARAGRIQPRYPLRDREAVRAREQRLLALHAAGATHAQMAQAVGLAPGSVNQTLVRLRARDQPTAA